jgi:hypothetical protein
LSLFKNRTAIRESAPSSIKVESKETKRPGGRTLRRTFSKAAATREDGVEVSSGWEGEERLS